MRTAYAQSVSKVVIKGRILSGDELPLPGTLITISSENLMGDRQAQTDADGRFLFPELPPGVYSLLAERQGFATVQRPDLPVNAGRSTIVNITMQGGSEGQMIVEGNQRTLIDTQTADRGVTLTNDFLQRIPGRSYQGALQAAPGTTGGSNPNIGGAGYNENVYMLDGVNITDPVTGTFSMNFNFDSIEQLQVLVSAFDPEFGQNLGGAVNIITASGGNTLEFVEDVRYQNGQWGPKLDASYAADGTQLAPTDFDASFQVLRAATQVTGPIIRDKVWFIMSYQYVRSQISNVGIDLPRDFDGHYVFGKLTVQPSTAHRLSLTFQSDPSTIDNTVQSDRFVAPSAQGRQTQGGFLFTGQWDWFINPDAFVETRATLQKSFIERSGVPCTHDRGLGYNPCAPDELENSIDFTSAPRVGLNQAFNSGNFSIFDFDDRWRAVLATKLSVLQLEALGTHDVKVGASTDILWWSKIIGYPGNLVYYDLNNLSYNPDTFTNYIRIEYSNPLQYSVQSNQIGLFVQDVYQPASNLTVRYGTRYDRAIFRNDVGEDIIDVGVWGPRLSLIWDPWGDAQTALKASVGRFNNPGRIGVADFLSQGSIGSKRALGEFFDVFTSQAADTYLYAPSENTNLLHDKATAPRSDEFMVGVERQIGRDIAFKTFFNGKFTRNLYAFDEVNLIWDGGGYNILASTDGSLVSYSRLRTPDIANRTYYRADASVEKIWSDRWEMQLNYSYTVSRGSVQNAPSGFLAVPQQAEYYLNGNLGTDIRHDVSAGLAWDLPDDPWTTRLGMLAFLESGYPVSRTYSNGNFGDFGSSFILKDAVGTYARTMTWWELNVQIQQAIPTRKGKLFGVFEVENLTNWRAGQLAGVSQDNRWIVTSRQSPIRMTVGGRYEF